MRRTIRCLAFFQMLALVCCVADEGSLTFLKKDSRNRLAKGDPVVLSRRPDKVDKRFVTMGQLMTGSRAEIWTVINDKEGAENFVDGILASDVIEEGDGYVVVEQETHVGGPKGSYHYTLRHEFTGLERADFKFVKGEMKDVEGTWWVFDWPVEDKHLVVYSLHIDPGSFAPQFIVQRGMKKSIPGTFLSMQNEILRRRKAVSAAKR